MNISLNEVRKLPEYRKLIEAGLVDITNDKQEKDGDLCFEDRSVLIDNHEYYTWHPSAWSARKAYRPTYLIKSSGRVYRIIPGVVANEKSSSIIWPKRSGAYWNSYYKHQPRKFKNVTEYKEVLSFLLKSKKRYVDYILKNKYGRIVDFIGSSPEQELEIVKCPIISTLVKEKKERVKIIGNLSFNENDMCYMIGDFSLDNILDEFNNKNVKITIEDLEFNQGD